MPQPLEPVTALLDDSLGASGPEAFYDGPQSVCPSGRNVSNAKSAKLTESYAKNQKAPPVLTADYKIGWEGVV